MTRINTNVSSLVAQNRLNKTNSDLNTSLTRLSTGLRINTGKDDPAGLIASEALRSDITGINKAISNTQRANQIIATADSALGQVSSLLNDIRGLVTEASNRGALSDDEIAANQLQVDSSLEAINRIAQTTTFQGRRLLDGSLDFITSAGTGFNTVADLQIDQANLGAAGSISVNVEVSQAATKATVSSTGIPSATTAVQSSGTVTFGSATAADEASGTLAFADSFTIGAEANATVTLANSYLAGNEASVNDFQIGDDGANATTLDIDVVDGSAADGAIGNDVEIIVNQVANGTASTASYDAGNNQLTLNIEQGEAIATVVSDLDGSIADFDIAAGTTNTGTDTTNVSTGNFTNELAGGTNTTTPGTFNLSARDGGAADGAVGNDTLINLTSGVTTAASYDSANNELNITVADGATVAQIAAAINSGAGADFVASNVTNGTSIYDATDNFTAAELDTNGGAISSASAGTNPTLASSFVIEAVNTGAADGTEGNNTVINIAVGASTAATYDADTDTIDITVAEGANTQAIADVVAGLSDFVVRNVQNGNALFNTGGASVGNDVGPTFTGGTDTTVNDVITVTADDATPDADGATITLVSDNSLAAGQASAAADTDGNITVNVSSNGAVAVGTIASAISELDGYSASVTESNGDGSYDILNDTAATTTALSGGVFGGGLTDDLVVQLTGSTGSEVFQFEKGASLSSIIQSINLVSDATSIVAEDDGGNLKLSSSTFGSDSLVDVEVISEGTAGTFETGLTASRANGTDIDATVNGTAATGDGNKLTINTATLDLSLTVTDGSSTSINFEITGGGALFQLGGDVVSNQQARLGIGSLSTGKLGGVNGRLYELGQGQSKALVNDITGAGKVIDEVINKVTSLRGRLGAFQSTTLESNLVSLNDTVANLTEAESSIRDADFAAESARLTRAQILVQSGTSVLGIANQNPQNVLSLLR